MEVAEGLSKLYREHPELLPIAPETKDLIATTVVKLLAGYRYTCFHVNNIIIVKFFLPSITIIIIIEGINILFQAEANDVNKFYDSCGRSVH